MDDKLFIGARSSILVTPVALIFFGGAAIACTIFHLTVLSAVLFFLLILCAAARLWGSAALRHVETELTCSASSLFPPGEVTLRLTVENRKNLPLLWMEVLQLLDENAPLLPADPGEICRAKNPDKHEPSAESTFLYKKFTFVSGHEKILFRKAGYWR